MLSSRFTTFGFFLTRALSLSISRLRYLAVHTLSPSLLLSQPSAHISAMICFATVVVRERHLAAAAVDNYAMWENLLSVLSIVVYPNRLSLGVCLCECVRHRRIYDYLAPVFHPAPVSRPVSPSLLPTLPAIQATLKHCGVVLGGMSEAAGFVV